MKAKSQPKREVKVMRVRNGILGRAHTRNIRRTIEKWGRKGFTLEQQNSQPGGCGGGGYTLLTFIKEGSA